MKHYRHSGQHRVQVLADRIREIEQTAAYQHKHGKFTDADWATHPLAIEYRALVKEWWTLPALSPEDAMLSPTWDRLLTAAGTITARKSPAERYLDREYSRRRKQAAA